MDAAMAQTRQGKMRGGRFDDPLSVPKTSGESRKGSMTSQSGINRIFRRGGKDNGGDFNEDAGGDIDFSALGTQHISLEDITHMRDRGPYSSGFNASRPVEDSTPIIPTIGTGAMGLTPLAGGGNASKMSNLQYRKQMNSQMKMAYANGARAMSLANTPGQNQGANDPRTMSFNSYGNSRTMSMMSGVPVPPGGPRQMSMNNRAPPGPGGYPRANSIQNGPRANSFLNGSMPNGPRANSFQNGSMPNGPMPNGSMNGSMPNGPRAMSMGRRPGMGPGGSPLSPLNGQNQGYFPQSNNPQVYQGSPQNFHGTPQNYQGSPQNFQGTPQNFQGTPQNYQQPNQFQPPAFAPPSRIQSTESLNNVIEEEEPGADDEYKRMSRLGAVPQRQHSEIDLNGENTNDDDEDDGSVYSNSVTSGKFSLKKEEPVEPEVQTMRHSLKPTNSMRLKKLDLFGNGSLDDKPLPPPKPDAGDGSSLSSSLHFESQESQESEDVNSSSQEPDLEYHNQQQPYESSHVSVSTSPKFGATQPNDDYQMRYSMYDSFEASDNSAKFRNLGASAQPNDSRLGTNEVFVTAQDLVPGSNMSPKKLDTLGEDIDEDRSHHNFIHDGAVGASNSLERASQDGQPNKSLVSNTAFSKLRTDSQADSNPAVPSGSYTPSTMENDSSSRDLSTTLGETESTSGHDDRRSSRSSRNFSISQSSKNFFKRLSKSSRRSVGSEFSDAAPLAGEASPIITTPGPSRDVEEPYQQPVRPIHFTKEEMAIMTCNSDLLGELEMVTTELARSIKRELAVDQRASFQEDSATSAATIADLQEKLNRERRMRFLAEEHALLHEHGQTPSALKLNYEKSEVYRQLNVAEDTINQLRDRLAEVEGDGSGNSEGTAHQQLVDKYHELLQENTDLKFRVIPELERKFKESEQRKISSLTKQLSLVTADNYSDAGDEIATLKKQRDELREVVTSLTSRHKQEIKGANDRVRQLEKKVDEYKVVTNKLSGGEPGKPRSVSASGKPKLPGLAIVSPNRLFET